MALRPHFLLSRNSPVVGATSQKGLGGIGEWCGRGEWGLGPRLSPAPREYVPSELGLSHFWSVLGLETL